MSKWSIKHANDLYRVERWGGGYFRIGENGNLNVTPVPQQPNICIDMAKVVEEIKQEGIQFPVVVRFHDILHSQVKKINTTFRKVIEDEQYQGNYLGVYPVKVNQMREVVEEIVAAGEAFNYGLEAGSKAELLTVLAYNANPDALTILNGYKDEEFMRLAMLGRKLDRKIIVVVEKFTELVSVVNIAKSIGVEPIIGIRAKMTVVGKGKWQGSGGDRAKFGLSFAEIINATEYLKQNDLLHCLKLLHFHIGSQLTDIRSVKDAVNESALIYAELRHMGVPLEYLDVGGGLGIDYDGSQSTGDSSRNYSIEEYVTDIVYGLKQLCDIEKVPHPTIVSESGRAITAHHSCVITQILGEIHSWGTDFDTSPKAGEHMLVTNMRNTAELLHTEHRLQEVYNDASQAKEQAIEAFKLRVISLNELAQIETMYWQLMQQIQLRMADAAFVSDELNDIDIDLSSYYLCNFSVFQSAADIWAIDQLLPVVPITRMDEEPTVNCSLVDITCDSDGKIDKFIGEHGPNKTLPLHALKPDEDYFVGLFLTGAYQDVMGDMHNLFGRVNEVHVFSDDDDPEDFYIEEVVHGSSVNDVLNVMQYNPSAMAHQVKKMIDRQVAQGKIRPREGVKWTDFYEDCLHGYTYLKPNKKEI